MADWETTITKSNLIEEVLKALLKFSKSLTGSLLILSNLSQDNINLINTKFHYVSTIIVEEIIIEDSIDLTLYSLSPIIDIIRIYRSEFLNKTIDLNKTNIESKLAEID